MILPPVPHLTQFHRCVRVPFADDGALPRIRARFVQELMLSAITEAEGARMPVASACSATRSLRVLAEMYLLLFCPNPSVGRVGLSFVAVAEAASVGMLWRVVQQCWCVLVVQ